MSIETARPIRIGLIGYGLAGEVFHAPVASSVPGMELITIVTGNPERQRRARHRYPSARVVNDAAALWDSSADHDLVVVATPNVSHVPLGMTAIEAGVNVVIDKPLAASAADGHDLAEAAAKRGLMVTVFQNRRWDNDFLTVRKLLDEGVLGQIVRFESRYERWRPQAVREAWRERGAPEEAGGLLFDLGSHLVDQALQLFGRPTHVYAEVDLRRPRVQVDDDVFVAMTHPGGIRSHQWATVAAAIPGPRYRLLALDGAFEKYGLDPQEDALIAGLVPGAPGWGEEPEELWGRLRAEGGERRVRTEAGDYQAFYRGVADALRSGSPPPVDIAESIEGLEVLEAARESSRTAAVVRLPAR